MPEALKCPTCAAPLEYPPGGGSTMRCPYCQSTVVLADAASARDLSPNTSNDPFAVIGQALGQMGGKGVVMAQVIEMLRAGNKIEAIKIYRQIHGTDLTTAKTAIENLAASHSVGFGAGSMPRPAPSPSSGSKAGVLIALVIVLVMGLIFAKVFFSVHQAVQQATTPRTTPAAPIIIMPKLPTLPVISPAPSAPLSPPAFAKMTQEFGLEGMGPGQFKDSRSIAIDGAGHIYVGEFSGGRVQVFDSTGKFLTTWNLGHPGGLLNLTADRKGTVYAVMSPHIYRYDGMTGNALGECDDMNTDIEEDYIDAFAALDGNIYAVGGISHIVVLGPDGKIKNTIRANDKVGEAISLERVVVFPTGEIFALDRSRGIFKFAPDGRYINRFAGGDNTGPGNVGDANSLAADGNNHLYVGNDPAIDVYNADGRYLDSFGGRSVCFGITVTDKNEILGCFRNDHVVRKFVLNKR